MIIGGLEMKQLSGIGTYGFTSNSVISAKATVVEEFKVNLEEEIEKLEDRLAELKELKDIQQELIYLVKTTESGYTYVDVHGNNYTFTEIGAKKILINNSTYDTYRLVEYCEVRDLTKLQNKNWLVECFVDKAFRVEKIGK